MKFTRESAKKPCVSQCAQGGEIIFLQLGFSWSWSGKMGKTKKDTNARVARRREQTEEKKARWNKCAWIIFQWIWVGRFIGISFNKRVTVNWTSLLSLPSSQISTEPFSSLDSIFLLAWYDSYSFIRETNFRFFTHWCVFIRSSLFRTGKQSFPWSMFTYSLIELHLIRKMLGLTCWLTE